MINVAWSCDARGEPLMAAVSWNLDFTWQHERGVFWPGIHVGVYIKQHFKNMHNVFEPTRATPVHRIFS